MRMPLRLLTCLTWDGEIVSEWKIGWQQNTKNKMLSDPHQAWVRAPRGKLVTLQLSKDFLKIPLAAQEENWPISGSGINRLIKGILKNSFLVLKYISHWAVIKRKFLSGPGSFFLWFDISLGVLCGSLPGHCAQGLHSWVETPAQVSHSVVSSCFSLR